MVGFFTDVATSLLLGLLTPLTALCVLPLYPGFLAYLANQLAGKESKKLLALFGVVVTAGVILFMGLLGLIFTTFLQASLTNVIGIVSPIAFGILGVISILLIFNVDIGQYLPKVHAPIKKNPLWSALIFGFFFGAIVVPCNPLFIAAMFAKAVQTGAFARNIINFLFFGIGMGLPLLVFSIVSIPASKSIIGFLTKYAKYINRIAGIIMLIVSLYYLIFVFRVFG